MHSSIWMSSGITTQEASTVYCNKTPRQTDRRTNRWISETDGWICRQIQEYWLLKDGADNRDWQLWLCLLLSVQVALSFRPICTCCPISTISLTFRENFNSVPWSALRHVPVVFFYPRVLTALLTKLCKQDVKNSRSRVQEVSTELIQRLQPHSEENCELWKKLDVSF